MTIYELLELEPGQRFYDHDEPGMLTIRSVVWRVPLECWITYERHGGGERVMHSKVWELGVKSGRFQREFP